jgi:hypothetical protein
MALSHGMAKRIWLMAWGNVQRINNVWFRRALWLVVVIHNGAE